LGYAKLEQLPVPEDGHEQLTYGKRGAGGAGLATRPLDQERKGRTRIST